MTRYTQRLEQLRHQGRSGLVTYLTAGDPQTGNTSEALLTLARAGADLIELGMPFSDPMADGPTLQRAALRALAAGETVQRTLASVQRFRESDQDTPVVLMGYANPVWQYGVDAFCQAASKAGVDGLLLVDLPTDQGQPLRNACDANGMLWPRMVAPATDGQRLGHIAEQSTGFLYLVARNGVTGSGEVAQVALEERLAMTRGLTDQPLAVGFGLRKPEHFRALNGKADWIVIGSALHDTLEAAATPQEGLTALAAQVAELRRALDVR
ncbi:tryptophan synthase subunit alpha [Mangrovitalea sediminis]|uniref:tryptophan synthase subunit alpha n=1 Tax=Mangrovitalea sediminis TaxID=1982043 RepID=UPI00130429CB|nr:tryptophan synthase subunit alpha [Mangrovitalea sediminis]